MVRVNGIVIIAVMMQRNAVELLEGVCNFTHGSSEAGIQRDALSFRRTDIDALTFFHIPEVGSFDAAALVRDHGRLHMAQQRPLSCTEERMGFYVGGTSA